MKTLRTALAALALALPGAASAQLPDAEFTISAGRKGGSYYRIAGRLRTQLTLEHGSSVDIETSKGSLENLARLEDARSKVSIGLAQSDALGRYLDENPAFAEEFLVLADVGRECVFLVASAKAEVGSLSDLAQAGGVISVDSPSSGTAVTWEAMRHVEPSFRRIRTTHLEVMESLLQLQNGPPLAEIDAVMFVQRPKVVSPPLEVVLKSPDRFRIVPIRPGDLAARQLPGGDPVYGHDEVTVRYAGNEITFETICTRGLLLAARSKLSEASRSKLIEVLLKSRDTIAGPETEPDS